MINEKPCLVPAGQGFSVLYKGRYLYSKYNPVQSCERLVSSLKILPGSLIVIFSPLLGYGLQTLLQKIDNDSYIIGVETDPVLFEFSKEYIKDHCVYPQFEYITIPQNNQGISEFLEMCNRIVKIDKRYFFKRLISITFAASATSELFKSSLKKYTDSFIDFFWKNRITLTKMGRLYARNIFKNLGTYNKSHNLLQHSISKPIFVLGAGISLEEVIPFLKQHRDYFFVICVDSALMPLLEQGIRPDIVTAVECQLANVKAFIGSCNSYIHLDADLTSRPHIQEIVHGTVSFFLSEYEYSAFINRLKRIIPVKILPPLGSVGLAAVHTALFIRRDSVPIFLSGLDFCYMPGKTHCRGAPHHRFSLAAANRLNIPGSTAGFFSRGTELINFQSHTITDAALKRYSLIFDEEFSHYKNMYNLSKTSLIKKIPHCGINEIEVLSHFITGYEPESSRQTQSLSFTVNVPEQSTELIAFLKDEKNSLERIKDSLIHGSLDDTSLLHLLEQHDYLYLHFPDGYKKPDMSQGFLKRIRAEIDFFLKDIDFALSQL